MQGAKRRNSEPCERHGLLPNVVPENSSWHAKRRKTKGSSRCVNCFVLRPQGVANCWRKRREATETPAGSPRLAQVSNPRVLIPCVYKTKALTKLVRACWRKRRDSNPCTDCSVTAFRVRAVITTSIRFHMVFVYILSFRSPSPWLAFATLG